jgi:hypothetical protein
MKMQDGMVLKNKTSAQSKLDVKVAMDRISKISELLTDYGQMVAHAFYTKAIGKASSGQELSITKSILKKDILELIDEMVQKRPFLQDMIDAYFEEANKRLSVNKKEMESKVNQFIRQKHEKLFESEYGKDIDSRFNKMKKEYEADIFSLNSRLVKLEKKLAGTNECKI